MSRSEQNRTTSVNVIAWLIGGAVACVGLLLMIACVVSYQWKRRPVQAIVATEDAFNRESGSEQAVSSQLNVENQVGTVFSKSDPAEVAVDSEAEDDPVENSNPSASELTAAKRTENESGSARPKPVSSEALTPKPTSEQVSRTESIYAHTIDQWSLPADESIVDAGIFRWIDDENAFHLRQPLVFAGNSLRIDATQGGLGQSITLFRMNPEGVLRTEKTKWELDHHTDWLMIQTTSGNMMLALGREPSSHVDSVVTCDVFGDTEPVGSDVPESSASTDGILEIPINTFRASSNVGGITSWSVVPPFSKSRLQIDEEWVPWDELQVAADGLSCHCQLDSQGDWMVAIDDEPDDSPSASSSSQHSKIRCERQRQNIRTRFTIELTSTLDDRLSGKWSPLYVNELTSRQRETIERTIRRSSSRRKGWRRSTSPMDLQAEDTAYLRFSWFHFRSGGIIQPDTPDMVDLSRVARQQPITLSVVVPEVGYVDDRKTTFEPCLKHLVFAEFQVTCH